ncbi:hypothetical protein GCM10023189_31330 [Nibrella saemangeumensis]|uniref:DUF4249 domain-containing protein n=1 Tax=Nibrella saemangeumensis TaxID=1084526 RepID=A0ABP8N280_9BACT
MISLVSLRLPRLNWRLLGLLVGSYWLTGCVDSFQPEFNATVNVVVVDGTITNLPESQVIRLNRSRADPFTGRFGNIPLTKAQVQVIVDGSQVVNAHETVEGSYQLPSDFRGQVRHSYQLRFRLEDGSQYESSPQIMPDVPPIDRVYAQFNPRVPRPNQPNAFMGAHEFYLDMSDPADQQNYYKWDWKLYEKQAWCRSCTQGIYAVYNIIPGRYMFGAYYVSGDQLYEDCFNQPPNVAREGGPPYHNELWYYDYTCRTQCWEILHNYTLNLFDDALVNGNAILGRKVALIPYYQRSPCLVEIRQSALTKEAHRFFKLVETQTQNTGGLADTPPSAPVGNVKNTANARENVVGFFGASAASVVRYWLDRKDATGMPVAAFDDKGNPLLNNEELFYALNGRRPEPEPYPPYTGERLEPKMQIWGGPPRVPTAICVPSDSRTPFKPEGWQE